MLNEQQKKTLHRLYIVGLLVCAAIIVALWTEVKAIEQGHGSTISEINWIAWANEPGAMLAVGLPLVLAAGILLGHLFWQSSDKYDEARKTGLNYAVLLALLPFAACGGIKLQGDELVRACKECRAAPATPGCRQLLNVCPAEQAPAPEQKPSAPPDAKPDPEPSTPPPVVVPDPKPDPKPSAPPEEPSGSACPRTLPAEASLKIVTGVYALGADGTPRSLHATLRVRGSKEYCAALGHQAPSNDCHLEGWPKRTECELELMGGLCPTWQYQSPEGIVGPCVDDQGAPLSCDHFGSPDQDARDDPKTPEFEGKPAVCGLQRGQFGPEAGFFVVPHGLGFVRACIAGTQNCGDWVSVNH